MSTVTDAEHLRFSLKDRAAALAVLERVLARLEAADDVEAAARQLVSSYPRTLHTEWLELESALLAAAALRGEST